MTFRDTTQGKPPLNPWYNPDSYEAEERPGMFQTPKDALHALSVWVALAGILGLALAGIFGICKLAS